VTEEEFVVSKPSEEKEEVDQQQTSSSGLLEIMKSLLPSTLQSKKTDVISSEEPISTDEEEEQENSSSYITETSSIADSLEENPSHSIESAVDSEQQEQVSSPVLDDFSSSDVYHEYKQPEESLIEEKHSSSIIDKATAIVSNIISSVSSALPTATRSEEVVVSSDTSSSDEEQVESQSVPTVEKATEMTESTISDDETLRLTVEERKIVVSKLTEESETKAEEVVQQPSSTGLFEIMKSFLPSAIRPKASLIRSSEEQISTTDEDKEIVSSSTIETTTTSKVFEEYPMETIQSVTPIEQQEDVSNQISSDTTETDVSHAKEEFVEQIDEEKDSTGLISNLTSVVSDAISAVQHVLPTSITSSTNVHSQKSPSEDDHIETSELTVSG
jgi:hypothetical protein